MKIVFLDAYTTLWKDLSMDHFSKFGEVVCYDYSSKKEGFIRAADADIVIVNKFVVDEDALNSWQKCKYVCVSATGYNNIDLSACTERGILVSNVSGYSTDSVAQYVFTVLLNALYHPEYYYKEVNNNRWSKNRDFTFYDHSFLMLNDLTLGVYGLGDIGQRVAQLGVNFGMKVLAVAKYDHQVQTGVKSVEPEELYSNSDVISLHVPLNDSTFHLINNKALGMMKDDAILINTSRGPVIQASALKHHLSGHPDFRAVLDVLDKEPPEESHELIGIENCFITPHIAWTGQGARRALIKGLEENIEFYLKGEAIRLVQ